MTHAPSCDTTHLEMGLRVLAFKPGGAPVQGGRGAYLTTGVSGYSFSPLWWNLAGLEEPPERVVGNFLLNYTTTS